MTCFFPDVFTFSALRINQHKKCSRQCPSVTRKVIPKQNPSAELYFRENLIVCFTVTINIDAVLVNEFLTYSSDVGLDVFFCFRTTLVDKRCNYFGLRVYTTLRSIRPRFVLFCLFVFIPLPFI